MGDILTNDIIELISVSIFHLDVASSLHQRYILQELEE
jgi:hypothetical protein